MSETNTFELSNTGTTLFVTLSGTDSETWAGLPGGGQLDEVRARVRNKARNKARRLDAVIIDIYAADEHGGCQLDQIVLDEERVADRYSPA